MYATSPGSLSLLHLSTVRPDTLVKVSVVPSFMMDGPEEKDTFGDDFDSATDRQVIIKFRQLELNLVSATLQYCKLDA
jgi:hypothetical protein